MAHRSLKSHLLTLSPTCSCYIPLLFHPATYTVAKATDEDVSLDSSFFLSPLIQPTSPTNSSTYNSPTMLCSLPVPEDRLPSYSLVWITIKPCSLFFLPPVWPLPPKHYSNCRYILKYKPSSFNLPSPAFRTKLFLWFLQSFRVDLVLATFLATSQLVLNNMPLLVTPPIFAFAVSCDWWLARPNLESYFPLSIWDCLLWNNVEMQKEMS